MRTQILHAEAAPYLGFARRLWRSLEELRLMSGVSQLQKYVVTDNIRIFLRCCESAPLIRIEYLGAPEGHILLASLRDGATHFSTFDYIKNKTGTAVVFPGSAVDGVLSSIFDKTCQIGERLQVKRNKSKWAVAELGGEALEFLGRVNDYEQAYFAGTDGIWVRHSQGLQQVSNIPSGHLLLPSLSGSFLNLFSFASYSTTDFWNQYRGASFFSITPTNGTVQEYGAWIPSFFVAEPADTYGLKPGWYYGRYPNPCYDMDNPLESLAVSLCAAMDTRYYPGLYAEGWCEMVTAVDGESRSDLYFYLEALTSPINSTAYRELVTGSLADSFITIGSALLGYTSAFLVTASEPGIKPDEVKLWNFASYTTDSHTSIDAVGALIIEGRRCRGYRYKGYATEFVDTAIYHSHALSNDGQKVAIFESLEGDLITSVQVFDLFGSRVKDLVENPDYSSGGFTLVRNSEVVAQLTALTGCFIPFREKGFEAPIAVFSSVSSPVSDSRNEFPSLASLRFVKSALNGLQIDKVVCENGVDATFGISLDPCFASTVVVDDPELETSSDRLVSRWEMGGVWKGLVRGNFAGNHPDMRFYGAGAGSSNKYGIITLNPTLTITAYEDGTYSVDGVAGDLVSTTCLTEDMQLDPDCAADCAGDVTITATSSCGQSGSLKVSVEVAPLAVSGTNTPTVGSQYSGSGGHPPYQYTVSAGAINPDTGIITSLSGACGTGSVTVIDSCGVEASKTVRFPAGQWVYEEDEWGNVCNLSSNQSCTAYIGAFKYVNSWRYVSARYPSGIGCSGCYSGNNVLLEHPCTGAALTYDCTSYPLQVAYVKVHRYRYKWECP